MTSIKRQKANALGYKAEEEAAHFLRANGFEILAQRYKTKYGEIDLIASKDGTIIFAEVKARSSIAEGLEAITPRSQKRISEAALDWMSHQEAPSETYRFDALIVLPDHTIHHSENIIQ